MDIYLWENNKVIINKLQRESKLFHSPVHGFKHWRTVEEIGLYLSSFNKSDPIVVSYFSYFHDCMRVNEFTDNGHGKRGGDYAYKIKHLLNLNDDQLELLYIACGGHTGGRKPLNDTIACCWDAYRLDIRRVGLKPDIKWFSTDKAKNIVSSGCYHLVDNL
jgi:uncharacterized protein